MDEQHCPNCGKELSRGEDWCPECGAARRRITIKRKLSHIAFGKPFSRKAAWLYMIIGGLIAAAIGGCGLLVALPSGDSEFAPLGWFSVALSVGIFAFIALDVRRSFWRK